MFLTREQDISIALLFLKSRFNMSDNLFSCDMAAKVGRMLEI